MYVNVHSHVRNIIVDNIFAVITKYTVLDEQRREAKEGKSQRQNPRSITRRAKTEVNVESLSLIRTLFIKSPSYCAERLNHWTLRQNILGVVIQRVYSGLH